MLAIIVPSINCSVSTRSAHAYPDHDTSTTILDSRQDARLHVSTSPFWLPPNTLGTIWIKYVFFSLAHSTTGDGSTDPCPKSAQDVLSTLEANACVRSYFQEEMYTGMHALHWLHWSKVPFFLRCLMKGSKKYLQGCECVLTLMGYCTVLIQEIQEAK